MSCPIAIGRNIGILLSEGKESVAYILLLAIKGRGYLRWCLGRLLPSFEKIKKRNAMLVGFPLKQKGRARSETIVRILFYLQPGSLLFTRL